MLRKRDENRITANEMCFMRKTLGYTNRSHKKEDILKEVKMSVILNHIHQCQNNGRQYVNIQN